MPDLSKQSDKKLSQNTKCHSERLFCHFERSEESGPRRYEQSPVKPTTRQSLFNLLNSKFSILHSKFLLLLCTCALLLFNIAAPAQAKYGGGTGEPNDPYLIYDANQMNTIGADSNDWDKHFKLMADIDLGEFTGDAFNIIGHDWGNAFTGVFDGNGHTISNFSYTSSGINLGLFGYLNDTKAEIKDLGLIDPEDDVGTGCIVGSLVGLIWEGTVTACYAEDGSVAGGSRVGGLVGGNSDSGKITNCYSTGSVSGRSGRYYVGGLVGYNTGWISNCYAMGSVSGNNRVGGLVGENIGTITNCYSTGSVIGNRYVGGLVGLNYYNTTIAKCYSTGSVSGGRYVGGLVGPNRGTITNCYATGAVTGNEKVGGFVGWNWNDVITDCYWDTQTSGLGESLGGEGRTTAQMQMATTFLAWGSCGNEEGIWTIDEGKDYPHLSWEDMPGETITTTSYGGGSGEPNDSYLIYTAEHLNSIGVITCHWDKHFKLMADIDLSDYTGTSFNIIGYRLSSSDNKPFTGVFDGNDHTISNFTYTSIGTRHIGLFRNIDDPNAEIRNLRLIDPNVDAGRGDFVGSLVGDLKDGTITNCYVEGGSVTGNEIVGGLVGSNGGTSNNCYSTASVSGYWGVGGLVGHNGGTIANCYSTASVSGGHDIGGLVGVNGRGIITNCYSEGSVSGAFAVGGLVGGNGRGTITNCYSASSVSGDFAVGGLVGDNHEGTISNCYSTGGVSGNNSVGGLVGSNSGTIINCYSTGNVSGTGWLVGGLVGYNWQVHVNNSFWDIETSGQTTSAGGTGLATEQMQTMSTFTDAGWDFVGETVNGIEDIWFIPQQDYPHLWWEGMQVPMKLTPRTLNCRSKGNWVKAHLTLPQGFTVADVDSNRPAVLHSFGFQSAPLYVSVNENELVQIEAAFEREAVCSLAGDWPQKLTVAGFLTDGNIFLGTSTVRMITPGLKEIGELSLYWLNADCVQPDFCDGIDLNRDSMVNLLDYALLLNNQVEFVSE